MAEAKMILTVSDQIIRDLKNLGASVVRWIPVSERLPEVGSDVLATYIEDDEIKVGITYYSKRGFYINTTIAWMPLPKAYREVEEYKEPGKDVYVPSRK